MSGLIVPVEDLVKGKFYLIFRNDLEIPIKNDDLNKKGLVYIGKDTTTHGQPKFQLKYGDDDYEYDIITLDPIIYSFKLSQVTNGGRKNKKSKNKKSKNKKSKNKKSKRRRRNKSKRSKTYKRK